MRIAQCPELFFQPLKMLRAAWSPHGYVVSLMSSPIEYHWIPWALYRHDRQLGWARTPVEAIVEARPAASVPSASHSLSWTRPRLDRALLIHPRISVCIVLAV